MKKFLMFAGVMAVSAGFAIAQETISIPFVADNNSTGQATYVGLQNISAGTTVIVTVEYLNINGDNDAGDYAVTGIPDSGGTVQLVPGQSISFRPAVDDATEVEGPFQVSMPASYNGFGSLTMTTNTGTDAVAGRVVTYAPEGAFAHNVEIFN